MPKHQVGWGPPLAVKLAIPIETYPKAAQQGFVAAQFIVGRLEGYCVEKNEQSAYYWLKMAAENSAQVQQRSTGPTGLRQISRSKTSTNWNAPFRKFG